MWCRRPHERLLQGRCGWHTPAGEKKEGSPAMPAKSYLNGSYDLVAALESSSTANTWYRVLRDRDTRVLACDCPRWVFAQTLDTAGNRTCKHIDFVRPLVAPPQPADATTLTALTAAAFSRADGHPLVEATRQQWPGLVGQWGIEEREHVRMLGSGDFYHLVRLLLVTGDGVQASTVIGFADRHSRGADPHARVVRGTVAWGGYELGGQLARAAGFRTVGAPPAHFTLDRSTRPSARRGATATPARRLVDAEYGIADLMRVGERTNLGDGLRPEQRAEHTLRLFLGETMYTTLERQGFLDVPSLFHHGRVYRLRRDPFHTRDRRVRVIEQQLGGSYRYTQDYCLVRGQEVPEADHWLTTFLRFCSDERAIVAVVQRFNMFEPHSEDYSYTLPPNLRDAPCLCGRPPSEHPRDHGQLETVPAEWRPRTAQAAVA